MAFDTKKALTFQFADNEWPQKLLIGGVFYFLSQIFFAFGKVGYPFFNFEILRFNHFEALGSFIALTILALLLVLFSIGVSSLPKGYILQSIHNEINDQTPLMPAWEDNYKTYFIHGLYIYLINFIYLAVFSIVIAIPASIGSFAYFIFRENTFVSALSMAFSCSVLVFFGLLYVFVIPFVETAYAKNFNFSDAFRLDQIAFSISKVLPEYLISVGLSVLILITLLFVYGILTCTCLGILLIPFAGFSAILIVANLFAQTYKLAQEKLKS
jgi:hypothetical protein